MHPIRPLIPIPRHRDHTERRRRIARRGIHAAHERQQCRRRVDLPLPELHLERRPAASGHLDDRIDFEAGVVAVVQHRRIRRLGVHAEVTHYDRTVQHEAGIDRNRAPGVIVDVEQHLAAGQLSRCRRFAAHAAATVSSAAGEPLWG